MVAKKYLNQKAMEVITKPLTLIHWQSVHSAHMMAVTGALVVPQLGAQNGQLLMELPLALSENMHARHSLHVTARMKELRT